MRARLLRCLPSLPPSRRCAQGQAQAQAQGASDAVAGGGIKVAGWTGKVDALTKRQPA